MKIISNSDFDLLELDLPILTSTDWLCLLVVQLSIKKLFKRTEYKETAEWPSWSIFPDSDPVTAVAEELFFNRLCTYPIVIISIPYSLVCHICQKVLLKIKNQCICCFLFIHRHATVTKKEIRLIWHQTFLTSLCFPVSSGYFKIDCLMICSWIFQGLKLDWQVCNSLVLLFSLFKI